MGRGYQAGVSRVRYDFPACAFPTLFGILVEGISMDAGIPGLFRHHSRAMGFGVQFHRTPDSCQVLLDGRADGSTALVDL